MKRVAFLVILPVTVSAGAILAAPVPAIAAQPTYSTTEITFAPSELRTLTEADIAASADLQHKRRDYLNRSHHGTGKRLSTSDVTLRQATKDGHTVTLAMPRDDLFEGAKMVIKQQDGTPNRLMGFAAVAVNPHETPRLDTRDKAPEPGQGVELAYACRDIWFKGDPVLNGDNLVHDCYQKLGAKTNKEGYIYNRMSRLTQAKNGMFARSEVINFTARYREWKSRNRIKLGPYNTVPKPREDCTTQSYSVGGYGFNATIPHMNCTTNVTVIEKSAGAEAAVDWNGATSRQVDIDMASAYRTVSGLEPILSDYVWVHTRLCLVGEFPCFQGEKLPPFRWTDGGWS